MFVNCPACESRYRLSAARVEAGGTRIACPTCDHSFTVYPDVAAKNSSPPSSDRAQSAQDRSQPDPVFLPTSDAPPPTMLSEITGSFRRELRDDPTGVTEVASSPWERDADRKVTDTPTFERNTPAELPPVKSPVYASPEPGSHSVIGRVFTAPAPARAGAVGSPPPADPEGPPGFRRTPMPSPDRHAELGQERARRASNQRPGAARQAPSRVPPARVPPLRTKPRAEADADAASQQPATRTVPPVPMRSSPHPQRAPRPVSEATPIPGQPDHPIPTHLGAPPSRRDEDRGDGASSGVYGAPVVPSSDASGRFAAPEPAAPAPHWSQPPAAQRQAGPGRSVPPASSRSAAPPPGRSAPPPPGRSTSPSSDPRVVNPGAHWSQPPASPRWQGPPGASQPSWEQQAHAPWGPPPWANPWQQQADPRYASHPGYDPRWGQPPGMDPRYPGWSMQGLDPRWGNWGSQPPPDPRAAAPWSQPPADPRAAAPWSQPPADPRAAAPWSQPPADPRAAAPWSQPPADPRAAAPWSQPPGPERSEHGRQYPQHEAPPWQGTGPHPAAWQGTGPPPSAWQGTGPPPSAWQGTGPHPAAWAPQWQPQWQPQQPWPPQGGHTAQPAPVSPGQPWGPPPPYNQHADAGWGQDPALAYRARPRSDRELGWPVVLAIGVILGLLGSAVALGLDRTLAYTADLSPNAAPAAAVRVKATAGRQPSLADVVKRPNDISVEGPAAP